MIELKVSNLKYNATVNVSDYPSQYRVKDNMEVFCEVEEQSVHPLNIGNLLDKNEFLLIGNSQLYYIKHGVITDYNWDRQINYHYGDLSLTIKCRHEPVIADDEEDLVKEMI